MNDITFFWKLGLAAIPLGVANVVFADSTFQFCIGIFNVVLGVLYIIAYFLLKEKV